MKLFFLMTALGALIGGIIGFSYNQFYESPKTHSEVCCCNDPDNINKEDK
jgi:hypothetical protein